MSSHFVRCPSCKNDRVSRRASACPTCGAPINPSSYATLFDVVYGATLSYAVVEFIRVVLEVVERFNALKNVPAELERFGSPLALRFAVLLAILTYVLVDIADQRRRFFHVPVKASSQYLAEVLIAGNYAAAVALAARDHAGMAWPFAMAVALGAYVSALTSRASTSKREKRFFARESRVQAVGASVALIPWVYYWVTRKGEQLTPMYGLLFVLWVFLLLVSCEVIPRQGDPKLSEKYHLQLWTRFMRP